MKNVNKAIYKERVTQQVPSFVYEEYLEDGTFSLSTVAIFIVMASKSENYEFNKSQLYSQFGRHIVEKAFIEMMLSGHLIQVNYSLSSRERRVSIKFFVEPRTSSEVSRIVNTIISTQLKKFPSAKVNKTTQEYINKGIKLKRDFKEAKRRKKITEGANYTIEASEGELIECKEVPRIGGGKVFYVPKDDSEFEYGGKHFSEECHERNQIEIANVKSLLDGFAIDEVGRTTHEEDNYLQGYANKGGKIVYSDADGRPTNEAIFSEITCGVVYNTSDFGQAYINEIAGHYTLRSLAR
ncbi:hypothetical protein BCAH820_1352 [Bacillus cereus AH820]|uniref:Uncharacterized protein n=1 Tax=Bacillus cereus (strain AH820) TaxID=405535 RepID=B7JEW0_BACC0|nr:hypothetical protein [Bacillus cereus]ACK92307.1 hypothetical protein BCAH820_1352 [Bacillus cereus AH820]EJR47517.1 hypothetical protein IIK_03516 [Bacillus cereus VD102]